jgi:mycothiol synthase
VKSFSEQVVDKVCVFICCCFYDIESYNKMKKPDFIVRNYRPSDFDDYVRLQVATEKRDRSGRHISKQRLAENLGHPSFHPHSDLFIAKRGGRLVGYVAIFLEPGIGRALLDGLVHPLHRNKGIATELFDRAIQYAKKTVVKVVQICISETNLAARNFVSVLGLRYVRRFIVFKLDLAAMQLPDCTPGAYIIRNLKQGEEQLLTDIQNRSFADAWGFNPNTRDEIAYRINLSSCSPKNIIMSYRGDKPVGYCWTRMLSEKNRAAGIMTGEIHMLGVDPDFQKKGIGQKVLLAGLSYLKSNGITIVELTADSENRGGLRLYKSVGFKELMKTEWYEKTLS